MEIVGNEFINVKESSHELVFGIENAQDHLTLVSELRLSISLDPSREIRLSLLRPKARCVRGRLLGYSTSVMEGIGDEFISMRKNLSHELSFGIGKAQDHLTEISQEHIYYIVIIPSE